MAERQWPWLVALVGTLALILVVNPVGFLGGGLDDWHYLNAARCWAEHGPCLPQDHWQGRWPVVAPLGASIFLLGENRFSVGLPSLGYALGCLLLISHLGNRLFGSTVGTMSALLFLAAPIVGIELLDPGAGSAELLFLLASASFVVAYTRQKRRWQAFAAGLAWSLAFQVRETAIVGLPLLLIAAWVYARDDRRALLLAALGAAVPLAAEMLIFWQQTGDPLWRRTLAVAHTQIPSSELLGPIDRDGSPFFNPAYIANWRHEPGISLHWAIDGLANLVVNLKAGTTIAVALILTPMLAATLTHRERVGLLLCLAAALWWAGALIYALAVDPKARMMLVPLVLTAIAVALLLRQLMRRGSTALALAIVAAMWLVGMTAILSHPHLRTSEAKAREWARHYPGEIEIDLTGRRNLALVPETAEFAETGSGRRYLVIRLNIDCRRWAERSFGGDLTMVERVALSPNERIAPDRGNLCLFRYNRPIDPRAITQAKL